MDITVTEEAPGAPANPDSVALYRGKWRDMAHTLSRYPEGGVHAGWPQLATSTTLQWDASSGVCRHVELHDTLEHRPPPTFRVNGVVLEAPRARPYWTNGEICFAPVLPLQVIAWEKEASRVIFSLAAILMADNASEALARVTSELVWFPAREKTASSTPSVYPVILGRTSGSYFPMECTTIVPSLQAHDPLQRHIALVLQTATAAKSRTEQLYAETLTDALMTHFLQRYAASQPGLEKSASRLVPYKLQRTLAYIHTHLAQKLSLSTLALVAQMSPTHFAHLFKHTTGLAPHRYIILYRIEQAKRLLIETEMTLVDIGLEVGFSDQSHFTALFRKHVSMTPKTYRDATPPGADGVICC